MMVAHKFFSISSVFGGKNSKEIAGAVGARCPSLSGEITSVMAGIVSRQASRGSFSGRRLK